MTRRNVERWLDLWCRRLAPGWQVTILWGQEPKAPDTGEPPRACIQASDHYESAVLRIDREWKNGWEDNCPPGSNPAEEVEVALVHELLHVALRDSEFVVGQLREEFLSPEGAMWLDLAYTHAEEGFIERQARLLVALGSVR